MNEADRERLLDLIRREIYANKLGVEYMHEDEDRVWWAELRRTNPREFDQVVVEGRGLYEFYEDEAEELRSPSEAERGGEAQG